MPETTITIPLTPSIAWLLHQVTELTGQTPADQAEEILTRFAEMLKQLQITTSACLQAGRCQLDDRCRARAIAISHVTGLPAHELGCDPSFPPNHTDQED
jgi:hypothetical protein